MKIRQKETNEIGSSSTFNLNAMNEILVYFEDSMDTDYPSNYDFYIESISEWVSYARAFGDENLIITDNENTCFFEPENEEDKQRGYTI